MSMNVGDARPLSWVALAPRPRELRRRPSSLVDVALDPAQRGAVTLPAGRALLVLGEAGHGKTTVALHRVAHLWRAWDGRERPRVAMIVPSEGLARSLQPLLRRLGVDVQAQTFDRWAGVQARRAFPDVPRRESEAAGPLVSRLKRDPSVRVALEVLRTRAPGLVDGDRDAARAPSREPRASARRGDLQHLFGDRVLLEAMARTAPAITPRMIDEVLEHTRVQFSQPAEEEWAHVTDRERLVTLDARRIDEGTSEGDAGSVDVEDYAVLFELDRMRAAARGRRPAALRLHDVVAIDEAQEFAPLELAMLRRALAPGGTLIVAGDADQQTDATSAFLGWDATMRELGAEDCAVVELAIGYRCPPDVVGLARALREPEEGHPPARFPTLSFPSEPALLATLGGALLDLKRRDPTASVAVVCRAPATANRAGAALRRALPVRVVFDGRFIARGPVQVTTVDEVKGLEFDFVVVPDATSREYPDLPASRRALYVAVTRARHALVLAAAGDPTPLVRR